ncbi:DUF397 domain-containing protein [Streptomyces sp. NPDC003483]
MSSTLRWFKSSYSDSSGGQCLEVAHEQRPPCVDAVHLRDSKNPAGPTLTVSPAAWRRFAGAL